MTAAMTPATTTAPTSQAHVGMLEKRERGEGVAGEVDIEEDDAVDAAGPSPLPPPLVPVGPTTEDQSDEKKPKADEKNAGEIESASESASCTRLLPVETDIPEASELPEKRSVKSETICDEASGAGPSSPVSPLDVSAVPRSPESSVSSNWPIRPLRRVRIDRAWSERFGKNRKRARESMMGVTCLEGTCSLHTVQERRLRPPRGRETT